MIPLVSIEALKRVSVDVNDLAPSVFLFAEGGYDDDQQMSARMFAAEFGIIEDPATGSANGCLAAYLVEHRYFGSSEIDVRVGQGYEYRDLRSFISAPVKLGKASLISMSEVG